MSADVVKNGMKTSDVGGTSAVIMLSSRTVTTVVVSSRSEVHDDVVVDDVTSVLALDVVEIKSLPLSSSIRLEPTRATTPSTSMTSTM